GEIEVIDCARRNEAKVAFSPKQLGHNLLPQDRKYILVQDCPPAVEWAIRNLPHMLSPHPPTSKILCFGAISLIRVEQPIRGCQLTGVSVIRERGHFLFKFSACE